MACWNRCNIISSSSASTSTTTQPQTPGRSSIALDRTNVRRQSRAYTRPASRQVSYSVEKLVEVGMATAFHRPPEIPIKCVSSVPSPGLSNSGSRCAALRTVSKQCQVMLSRELTPAGAPLSPCREARRAPCQPGRPNGDISEQVLGSWNKLQRSPSESFP